MKKIDRAGRSLERDKVEISTRPELFVSQAHDGHGWRLAFRRTFYDADLVQWHQLLSELDTIEPTEDRDSLSWAVEPSGQFSIASLIP